MRSNSSVFPRLPKGVIKKILLWVSIPLVAWYISANWYQLMLIQGRSMMPTYKHLQMVWLDKHTSHYTRGQVVAFSCDNLSGNLVKRIVALPGDRVQIQNGTLYVNGAVSDVYPQEGMFAFSGILQDEILLGAMEYLVIGDNAQESIDSRYPEVGIISQRDIHGIVCGS